MQQTIQKWRGVLGSVAGTIAGVVLVLVTIATDLGIEIPGCNGVPLETPTQAENQ